MKEAWARSSAASSGSPSASRSSAAASSSACSRSMIERTSASDSSRRATSVVPAAAVSEIGPAPGLDGFGVRERAERRSQHRDPRGVACLHRLLEVGLHLRADVQGRRPYRDDELLSCDMRATTHSTASSPCWSQLRKLPAADRALAGHLLQEEPGLPALPRGPRRSLRGRAAGAGQRLHAPARRPRRPSSVRS